MIKRNGAKFLVLNLFLIEQKEGKYCRVTRFSLYFFQLYFIEKKKV